MSQIKTHRIFPLEQWEVAGDSKTHESDDWMDVYHSMEDGDEVIVADYTQLHVVIDASERDSEWQKVEVRSPGGKTRYIWGAASKSDGHAGALRNQSYGKVADIDHLEIVRDDDEADAPGADLQRAVELQVESSKGAPAEYHYETVLLDPGVLADVREQHAENAEKDDDNEYPPLLGGESVLAHNLGSDTLDLLVVARGDDAGFDVAGHDHDHLTQIQDALDYADGSTISPREAECLFYMTWGASRRKTAQILGLGSTTVQYHRANAEDAIDAVPARMKALKQTKQFAEHLSFSSGNK